jgi:hypothetical protein
MAGLKHEITVGKLQELLATLEPTDVLTPNRVNNLLILRDGGKIGYIDLFTDAVELFDEDVDENLTLDHLTQKVNRAERT